MYVCMRGNAFQQQCEHVSIIQYDCMLYVCTYLCMYVCMYVCGSEINNVDDFRF